MTSSEVKKATLELLRLAFRVRQAWLIGSHVGKITTLELMARIGAQTIIRKFLGYHMDAENMTMATYARENCAEPLRHLQKMLLLIRVRLFMPDCTKSGLFMPGLANVGFDKWVPGPQGPVRPLREDCYWYKVLKGLAAPVSQDGTGPDGYAIDEPTPEEATAADHPVHLEEEDSDTNSSGASDTDADEVLISRDTSAKAKEFGISELELEGGDLFFHEVFKTIHKLKPMPEPQHVDPEGLEAIDAPVQRLKCGRHVRKGFMRLNTISFDWPKCKICFA